MLSNWRQFKGIRQPFTGRGGRRWLSGKRDPTCKRFSDNHLRPLMMTRGATMQDKNRRWWGWLTPEIIILVIIPTAIVIVISFVGLLDHHALAPAFWKSFLYVRSFGWQMFHVIFYIGLAYFVFGAVARLVYRIRSRHERRRNRRRRLGGRSNDSGRRRTSWWIAPDVFVRDRRQSCCIERSRLPESATGGLGRRIADAPTISSLAPSCHSSCTATACSTGWRRRS